MDPVLLKNYWNFFAMRKYSDEAKLFIFLKGNFAIKEHDKVFLYAQDGELIKEYSQGYILECGVIGEVVELDENTMLRFYSVDDNQLLGEVEYLPEESVYPQHSAIIFNDGEAGLAWKVALFQNGVMKVIPFPSMLQKGLHPYFCKVSSQGLVYISSRSNYLWHIETNEMVEHSRLSEIYFFPNGNFIAYFGNSHYYRPQFFAASDWKTPKFVANSLGEMMVPCGPLYTLFQKKLLLSTECVVREVDSDVIACLSSLVIKPYVLKAKDLTGYWFGKKFLFARIEKEWLVIFSYDGQWFPIAVGEYQAQRSAAYNVAKENLAYRWRLLDIIPH